METKMNIWARYIGAADKAGIGTTGVCVAHGAVGTASVWAAAHYGLSTTIADNLPVSMAIGGAVGVLGTAAMNAVMIGEDERVELELARLKRLNEAEQRKLFARAVSIIEKLSAAA